MGCSKRRVGPALALGLALALASSSVAPSALAYRTSEDSPALQGQGRIAWQENPVSFWLSDSQLPPGVSKDEIESALARSLDTWNGPQCSTEQVSFAGWVSGAPAPKDGTNTIAWVSDWQARGFPEDAPGNTDVQYRGSTGDWRIAEADVYLNAHDFDWVGSNPGPKQTLVEAVLTHELGHALGLLHPCEPDGADGAPACEDVDAAVAQTTMYPFYSSEQVTLADDDVAGICYLYGQANTCGGACTGDEICMDGECRVECKHDVCEAGQQCGYWGCIPKGTCAAQNCAGEACSANVEADCGPFATCNDEGVCVQGAARWGDGCSANSDCKEGVCVGAVCQPLCETDDECAPFGTCQPSADERFSGCIDSGRYEDGANCKMGEDCRSHICIFMGNQSQCTNDCKTSDTCEAGWSCKEVDKRNVCVPREYRAGGGCSLSASSSRNSGWGVLCAALLFSACRRRVGSRRSARYPQSHVVAQ